MKLKLPYSLTLYALIFLGTACNVAEKQTSKNSNFTTNISNTKLNQSPKITIPSGAVIGYELQNFNYQYNFSTTESATGYSVANLPVWATFNSSSGLISGIARQGLYSNIVITKYYVGGSESSDVINFFVHGDPLFQHSWHMDNSGQKAFSLSSATMGVDLNMLQTLYAGINGNGVKILISDTGVDAEHEDLDDNIILSDSKNYNNFSVFPYDSNGHGTAVAGIIAAEAMNNIGGRGIASAANLSVKNFLESSQNTSITIDQANGPFDIFNFSYGDLVYHDQKTSQDYVDQLKYGVDNLRGGLGAIYVKSAGNEFYITAANYAGVANPVFSHNANLPLDNEWPYLVLVGAINAEGKKASYSNAGSNLWVVAPGGESDYGQYNPAILTTDISGCSQGYAKNTSSLINNFEYGHSLNTVCNYTSTMNGTSAATPMVSAAIALILEENPNLTWRDVKHILATTSRKIDDAIGATPHPSHYYKNITNFDLSGHTYEQGWVINEAGFHFHNWYGFGAIDVDAAVNMASSYNLDLKTQEIEIYSRIRDVEIPDANPAGVTDTVNVTGNLIAESIQIEVEVNHLSSGDVGVELTSPSGTKSILLNINNSLLLGSDSNLSNVLLLSNAFYGESSTGAWTIKLIDGQSGVIGRLKSWKLKVFGRQP